MKNDADAFVQLPATSSLLGPDILLSSVFSDTLYSYPKTTALLRNKIEGYDILNIVHSIDLQTDLNVRNV
jgi:hypothetical protein